MRSLRSWISEHLGREDRDVPPPPRTGVLEELRQGLPAPSDQTPPRLLMVAGKGGTGKTTVACSLALGLMDRGVRVMVASIDPAHNLGDVLGTELGPEPSAVDPGRRLFAAEVDLEEAVRGYLERTHREVRHAYRYLQVLNLEKFLDTLRYAPGVEEQATMEAVTGLLEAAHSEGCGVLLLDTPPTGLTLRVLALPTVSVRWAEGLQQVRQEILKKREVIQRATGPEEAVIGEEKVQLPARESDDEVSGILKRYLEEASGLMHLFADPGRSGVVLVTHPDRLSVLESERMLTELGRLGIPLALVVWNRLEEEPKTLTGTSGHPVRRLPLLPSEPSDPETLRDLAGRILEG